MKFLIAIGSKDYSGPTLELGMRVANAFNAAVDIVFVGEKISAFSTAEVILAQENLENWELDRKGVDVLQWAYEYLVENEYIHTDSENSDFHTDKLIQTDDDRCEVNLKGRMTQEVGLILRNGDIIQQLRDEVKRSDIDCTIIGGSGERQMAHDLVQFIDSSIFIVKNFKPDQVYKILCAVDDSPGTNRARKYAVRVSQALNIGVDLLTISKTDNFGSGYKGAANQAAKFMRRSGIDAKNLFEVGDPFQTIVNMAGDNHLIIMGASTRSPIKKFFKSSKPLNVMGNCNCPILIVK